MRQRGTHYLLFLLFPCTLTAGRQADSTAIAHKWELTVDVGKTPLFNVWDQEWKQAFILRLGVGKSVEGLGKVHLFAEYQRQHSTLRWGDMNPWIMEKEYPRNSYGASLTLTLAEIFVIGGVTSVVSHGDMYYHRNLLSPPARGGFRNLLLSPFAGRCHCAHWTHDLSLNTHDSHDHLHPIHTNRTRPCVFPPRIAGGLRSFLPLLFRSTHLESRYRRQLAVGEFGDR